jgi:predicted nucleotidyltransferase
MSYQPNGLSQDTLNTIKNIIQQQLGSLEKYRIFFYGSRSRSDFKKYSDLDLWIEVNSLNQEKDLIASVSEALLESDIPIKVDIITPKSVLKEYLPSIKNDLKLWFEKL